MTEYKSREQLQQAEKEENETKLLSQMHEI